MASERKNQMSDIYLPEFPSRPLTQIGNLGGNNQLQNYQQDQLQIINPGSSCLMHNTAWELFGVAQLNCAAPSEGKEPEQLNLLLLLEDDES